MKDIDYSHGHELLNTAKALSYQGFSVIPVHGDNYPSQPKKPATQWGDFQKRIADPDEIASWFSRNVTAIGIVCGQISKLMVLDFDDLVTYRQFINAYPTYSDTFTVKTRRGYHLYFEVHQYIPSHHFDGGDIKGEKSYVIAPPSVVSGYTYKIARNRPHRPLLPHQVDEIFNHLQASSKFSTYTIHRISRDQPIDLIQIYDNLAPQLGRNNALYRTASIARDYDLPLAQTEDTLIYHHVVQPPPRHHKSETPHERFLEGQRTIQSAYQALSSTYVPSSGLPNSIREALLTQQNSTIVPRFLDILHIAKWKPQQLFSMADAIHLCQYFGLNRKSVIRALSGNLAVFNGQHIIPRRPVEYPDNRGLKSSVRGRPVKILYEVPSSTLLLNLLNVSWSPSDVIKTKDVRSSHAYRLALHREYIKRLSPRIPIAWLAERIGVDGRTIQRYNRELDVQITQNLGYFELSKANLDSLPKKRTKITKNTTNGFWLEAEDGRRYPAWRHVGSKLLKQCPRPVKVVVQQASQLSLSSQTADTETVKWYPITPSNFVKIQAFRTCTDDRPKLSQVVDNLFHHVKKRVDRVRYLNIKLHFDSVISYIAKDDVAETITSYLYAFDGDGNRVHRPAKRGIAYRMLKEFGDGNVYLALLDLHTEMWYALARHAMRFGQLPVAMKFLLSALD